MTVPMGQICLWETCDKPAMFMKDGSYYCAEHFNKKYYTLEIEASIAKNTLELLDACEEGLKMLKIYYLDNFDGSHPTITRMEKIIGIIKGNSDETKNT